MSSLKGASQLNARFKAMGKTEVLVRDIVIHAVTYAKHNERGNRKTGNLGRTIRPGHITASSGELLAGGQLRVGYARFVEKGTRPHVIRPRNRKALAWGGPRRLTGTLRTGAKPTHFAKEVHHPGSRPYPYLVPGLQQAVRERGITAIVKLWDDAA